MEPELSGIVASTYPRLNFIRRALLIVYCLIGLALVSACLYEFFFLVLEDFADIPPILKEKGMNDEISFLQWIISCIYVSYFLICSVMLISFMMIVIYYEWPGKIYEFVDHTLSKSPTVKATVFMSIWRGTMFYFGYIQIWIINLAASILYGAIIGLAFHRMARKFSPFLMAMCVFGILCALLWFSAVFYSVWVLKSSSKINPSWVSSEMKELLNSEGFSVDNLRVAWGKGGEYIPWIISEGIILRTEYNDKLDINVLGVLCHELGHRRYKHSIKNMLFKEVPVGALFSLIAVYFVLPQPELYALFGFATEPAIGALPITDILVNVIDLLLTPLALWNAREQEFMADRFAVEKGYGQELSRFLATNPEAITWKSSWLFEKLFLTHPPHLKRIEYIEGLEKKFKVEARPYIKSNYT